MSEPKHKLRQPIGDGWAIFYLSVGFFTVVIALILDHYIPKVAVGFALFMGIFSPMALCSRIERLETYIAERELEDGE